MSYKPLHDYSKYICLSAVLMGTATAMQWWLTATHPWTSWLMLDQLKRLLMIHESWAYWDESYLRCECLCCFAELHAYSPELSRRDSNFWSVIYTLQFHEADFMYISHYLQSMTLKSIFLGLNFPNLDRSVFSRLFMCVYIMPSFTSK